MKMGLEFITNFYFPQVVLDLLNAPILSSVPWFDWWMIVHLVVGFFLVYAIGKNNFNLALLIFIGYELFELILFNQGLAIPESSLNTIFDMIVGMIGYYFGSVYITKKI